MNDQVRNEFIAKMKERLDQIDQEIETIKGKSEEYKAQAHLEYEKRLHELRENRRDVNRKINDLNAAGEEKWQQLKDEAEHSWKALSNSFNYFKSHFK